MMRRAPASIALLFAFAGSLAASALAAPPAAAPASVAPVASAATAKPAPLAASTTNKAPPAKAGAPKPAASWGTASAAAKKSAVQAAAAAQAARRSVAGGPTTDDATLGPDSVELRALIAAERELFPPAAPFGSPWPAELPSQLVRESNVPRVHASGLPPEPIASSPPVAEGGRDLRWMDHLELPDLPVRWEPHLVRYLEFFKDDPRGRALFSVWLRRSGKYRDGMRRALRQKGLPEDLVWLSMIESGFDPNARSPVGAAGLWQFMPQTGKLYGLEQDRWVDQRFNPEKATLAAADFLGDLHRRLGSREPAIAAYNMGYGGMLSVVKRYNTNDYWALARLEAALPWETTLYVPKIVAAAIVARNAKTFGYADLVVDSPIESEPVPVPPGVALSTVAQAAGTSQHEIELLNPELRAGRTPPDDATNGEPYPVRIPAGKRDVALTALAKAKAKAPAVDHYVVRFGESLEQIATAHKTTAAKLAELNAIKPTEAVRGGSVLLVPHLAASVLPASAGATAATANSSNGQSDTDSAKSLPIVVVPSDVFVYPDRRRVFYRVAVGDSLRDVADAFNVSTDEVRRWNDLDPVARLHEGMTLQLFVPTEADLSDVASLAENQVHVVPVGSEEFFASQSAMKGRRRVAVHAKAGDTLASLARKYNLPPASLERVNRRPRSEAYAEGDEVVLYLPETARTPADGESLPGTLGTPPDPTPLGPLPEAPVPSTLPQLIPE